MLAIPSTASQATYVAATTFVGQSRFASGFLRVSAQAILVQFYVQPAGTGFSPQELPEVTMAANTFWNFVQGTLPLAGLRFRDASAGLHGQVTGLLCEEADPQVFIN